MKAITIWQPWASLIACGAKCLETRSWPPPARLIGSRIAIHAARKAPSIELQDFEVRKMEECLNLPQGQWHKMPFGAVLATAQLDGAYQIRKYNEGELDLEFCKQNGAVHGSEPLCGRTGDRFGDFRQGRWCWYLTDIERVGPHEARGQQGLWDWESV